MSGSRRVAGGWRMGVRMAAGDDRHGASLRMLAARFPSFRFGTRRMHSHVAIEAVRWDKDEPGVYAVVTDDPGEMRRALLEDEDSPPGSEKMPGGG